MTLSAYVDCNCSNRHPTKEGAPLNEPYFGKKRLSREQEREVRHWKDHVQDVYSCGHREGKLVDTWIGVLEWIAGAIYGLQEKYELSERFEGFLSLISPRRNDDPFTRSPHQAEILLLEVEDVREILSVQDEYFLHVSLWDELRQPRAWRVTGVDSWDEARYSKEEILESLDDGEKLCQASFDTGNPVVLLP